MLALREAQAAMAAAIRLGPGHMPGALFVGSAERVLLGLKVHANTISHGRLIALEDSFPLTRQALGQPRFNRLSRRFVEGGGGASASLAMIGAEFPEWLAAARTARWLVRLAQFEWAWLCAYRAADARAVNLGDLARLNQAALLDMELMLHPAARLVASDPRLSRNLDLPSGDWLLVTRPDAVVLVTAGGAVLPALFAAAHRRLTMAALLGRLQQAHPDTALLPLVTLAIGAGALAHAEIP